MTSPLAAAALALLSCVEPKPLAGGYTQVPTRCVEALRSALAAEEPGWRPDREEIAREIYASLHHLMRVTGTEAQDAYEAAARSILALKPTPSPEPGAEEERESAPAPKEADRG